MFDIEFSSITHQGKVRRSNQDYLEYDQERQFAVIADGIGGLQHGDIASITAVNAAMGHLRETLNEQTIDYERALSNSIKVANEHLITIQQNDERYSRMGTTLTSFAFNGKQSFFSWVGDSRLYLYQASTDQLQLLTKDHTLNPDKFDSAACDQMRRKAASVLTQSVGSILLLQPDTGSCAIESGDVLLACTDGLSDLVSHDYIHEQLKSIGADKSTEQCCDKLLDKALDVGGTDNVSLIVSAINTKVDG